METNDFLHVNNIQVVYNDVILAFGGISLRVPERGIVALLGANGAGKSTTLKAVSGLINKQNGKLVDGDIVFSGRSIAHLDPDAVVRMGIGKIWGQADCVLMQSGVLLASWGRALMIADTKKRASCDEARQAA